MRFIILLSALIIADALAGKKDSKGDGFIALVLLIAASMDIGEFISMALAR